VLYERDGVIYHHSVMNVGASVLGIEVYLILFDNVIVPKRLRTIGVWFIIIQHDTHCHW
jgi:hypothetical protein